MRWGTPVNTPERPISSDLASRKGLFCARMVGWRPGATKHKKQDLLQPRSLCLAYLSRMLRRMTDARRALLRKLEHANVFPLVALQALRELRTDLDALEAEAMVRARELGASLEDIAEALGITRQGVSYRLKVLAEAGHDDDAPAGDEIVDVREPDPRGARSD